jgi:hypothetical protein
MLMADTQPPELSFTQRYQKMPDIEVIAEPVNDYRNRRDSNPERSWFRKHLLPISIGALLTTSVVSFAMHPKKETIDKVEHNAPWIIGGLAGTEAIYLGGAGLMMAGAAKDIGNPFKLKSSLPKIEANIYENPRFRTGLWANTAGAVLTTGVLATGIMTSLPPAESWGALGLVVVDLGGSLAIRSGILTAIHDATKNMELGSTEL